MYNPYSLEGKTILVTGASSGIGQATAIECSKLGANVVITARNEERLKKTFDALDTSMGQQHQMVMADVSTSEGLDALVSALPALDGLSSNAGMAVGNKPIKFIKDDVLEEILNVNLLSHVKLARILFKKKKLKDNSSIVFTSSLSGVYVVSYGEAAYAASKGAISGFAKGAALEFASKGIRVNCVNPCIVVTDLFKSKGVFVNQEQIDETSKNFPLKRLGDPTDVAWAHVYLMSDASSWITGVNLPIDGGFTLK